MRTRVVLASLLVLALSIISATFTLLATTSKSWGTQAYYYDNGTELGLTEITPACTLERSPFYRCGLPRVDINGTCNITDCAYYKPYGTNRTSCRSAHEFGRIWSENSLAMGLLGMSQECQEVFYAGNLQIAASVFLVLGLCFTLGLTFFTVTAAMFPKRFTPTAAAHHQHDESTKSADAASPTRVGHRSDEQAGGNNFHSVFTPYVVVALLTCLYAGILTQILAQYFGVLGLTVNATPNAASARDAVGFTDYIYFQADSWAIGKGLSTYATTAWASAVACAAVATALFRRPRYPKML